MRTRQHLMPAGCHAKGAVNVRVGLKDEMVHSICLPTPNVQASPVLIMNGHSIGKPTALFCHVREMKLMGGSGLDISKTRSAVHACCALSDTIANRSEEKHT